MTTSTHYSSSSSSSSRSRADGYTSAVSWVHSLYTITLGDF